MHAPTHAKEPTPPDQTMLVLLAQTGDRAALEDLLRATHAPLRRYITRLAGAEIADDILQEASLQIFRKLPFLREPAVFRPWTLRIASRIAFAHLKRARRWQPLDDAPPEPHTPTWANRRTLRSSRFWNSSEPQHPHHPARPRQHPRALGRHGGLPHQSPPAPQYRQLMSAPARIQIVMKPFQ